MEIFRTISEFRDWRRGAGTGSIGFVPTMGALHDGHLSIIKKSKKSHDLTIASIFVNPAQFGPREDFHAYPRCLDRDIACLEQEKTDVLFAPESAEMYVENHGTWISNPDLSCILCGRTRPDHFKGVLTVVNKLLNLTMPEAAYFGKKDFQQLFLIKKMVNDLNMAVRIEGAPIVRNTRGLALSSRNKYLSDIQQDHASGFYAALCAMRGLYTSNHSVNSDDIISAGKKEIQNIAGMTVDYLSICDKNTLIPAGTVNRDSIIIGAVFFHGVRLIDNLEVATDDPC